MGWGYPYGMIGDSAYLLINSWIGQLCVVMFLFYSGYGTEYSILNKGQQYVDRFPKHRILSTLLNFDVAIIAFLIVDLALGIDVSGKKIALSFIGWEMIGNSNWYIFDILLCYSFSYLAAKLTKSQQKRLALITLAVVLLILVLHMYKKTWWYDTLLAYPAGVFLAQYKEKLSNLIHRYYWPILIGLLALFMVFYNIDYLYVMFHNLASVAFAFVILLLTMRIRVQNKWLIWFGVNLFPIYIYQRIPMMTIKHLYPEWVAAYPVAFVAICLLVVSTIAFAYKYIKIDFK